jgi:hypothetical protein
MMTTMDGSSNRNSSMVAVAAFVAGAAILALVKQIILAARRSKSSDILSISSTKDKVCRCYRHTKYLTIGYSMISHKLLLLLLYLLLVFAACVRRLVLLCCPRPPPIAIMLLPAIGHCTAPAAFFLRQQCQLCQYRASDDCRGMKMPQTMYIIQLVTTTH